jgi:hypothetical protein
MDTRYRDQGYTATFVEEPYGAFLTIKKTDRIVAQVSVGFLFGDTNSKAQIEVKRLQANEFADVTIVDDFAGR